jgi:hypothetical protein
MPPEPAPTQKPSYWQRDGFRMPLGFPPAALESALRYRARDSDVFLTAYPKCGTTWTQYMVYLLLNEGQPLDSARMLGQAIPHLEEVGAAPVEVLTEPRVIKTHLPLSLLRYDEQARYIYVARNPFDCVVSFFHHTQGFPRHYDFVNGRFDDFFECFFAGEVDFGDYFDHIVAWSHYWDRHNVLVLIYEDMQQDPQGTVRRIGRFLAPAVQLDESLVAAVVHHSSFAHMRVEQQRWTSRRAPSAAPFVRSGRVGEWQSTLSSDQARRLVEKFRVRTAGTRVRKLWPGIIEQAAAHAGPG